MAAGSPSTRTIARIFLTVAGLAGVLYLLYLIRTVLGLIAISVFLTLAFGPPVDFFSRRMRRSLAIITVYLCGVVAIVGIGLLVVPPIVTQVQGLANDIPGYLHDLRRNSTFKRYDNRYHITKKLEEQATKLPSALGTAAGALSDVTVGVFSAAVRLLTVLTITFFLLLDGARLIDFFFRLAGHRHEVRGRAVAGDIYQAVSGYVAGNLMISIIAGLVTYFALLILGVPFAVPLAVLMAFLDLIPLVGATIGAVLVGIVTLFNDFPTATIVWVAVAVIYQQIENNVIQPVVYRKTVAVHPLIVVIAILIGSALLGVLGALVAIPVAAAVQIVITDSWSRRRENSPLLPDAAGG